MVKVDDMKVVRQFEEEVAKYAGAKYGVAVSCQSNAIFLCLQLLKMQKVLNAGDTIIIPKQTYVSVPMSIISSGLKVKFEDKHWSGAYELLLDSKDFKHYLHIYDSAVRFTKDMYVKDSLYCVSFQYKKALPIGRGGMILTDSKEDADILRLMRFDGRTVGKTQAEDKYTIGGYNMYMLPEQAARGLTLMTLLPEHNKDIGSWQDYPDLSKQMYVWESK